MHVLKEKHGHQQEKNLVIHVLQRKNVELENYFLMDLENRAMRHVYPQEIQYVTVTIIRNFQFYFILFFSNKLFLYLCTLILLEINMVDFVPLKDFFYFKTKSY